MRLILDMKDKYYAILSDTVWKFTIENKLFLR